MTARLKKPEHVWLFLEGFPGENIFCPKSTLQHDLSLQGTSEQATRLGGGGTGMIWANFGATGHGYLVVTESMPNYSRANCPTAKACSRTKIPNTAANLQENVQWNLNPLKECCKETSSTMIQGAKSCTKDKRKGDSTSYWIKVWT